MSQHGNTSTGGSTPTEPNQSSMSASTNSGSVLQTPLHHQGGGDNEQKAVGEEISKSMQQMMATMQQQMQATMQQQMQVTMQQQMQLLREEQQKMLQQMLIMHQQQQTASTERLQRTTETTAPRQSFPQHSIMSPSVVEYSAGASLPLPPRVPSQLRSSIGFPSTPTAFMPFTPLVQRSGGIGGNGGSGGRGGNGGGGGNDQSDKDDEHHDDARRGDSSSGWHASRR